MKVKVQDLKPRQIVTHPSNSNVLAVVSVREVDTELYPQQYEVYFRHMVEPQRFGKDEEFTSLGAEYDYY